MAAFFDLRFDLPEDVEAVVNVDQTMLPFVLDRLVIPHNQIPLLFQELHQLWDQLVHADEWVGRVGEMAVLANEVRVSWAVGREAGVLFREMMLVTAGGFMRLVDESLKFLDSKFLLRLST